LPRLFGCTPSMGADLEGGSPSRGLMAPTVAKGKGVAARRGLKEAGGKTAT